MTALSPGLPAPDPAPDGVDAPFWEGLRRHRLVVPRGDDCGARRFPPEWLCPRCRSFATTWEEVAGRGRIFSWTPVWHPAHPALAEACPCVVVVVELDAQRCVRLVGNRQGDDPAMGAAVEAVSEDGDDRTLVQWRPA